MKAIPALFLSAALALPTLAAAEVSEDRVLEFIEVMVANDCVLPEATAAEVLPASGFERDEAGAIVKHLRNEGRMSRAKRTIYLNGPECESPEAVRAGALQVLKKNDCQVSLEEFKSVFKKSGLEPMLVKQELQKMVMGGEASMGANDTIILNAEVCS